MSRLWSRSRHDIGSKGIRVKKSAGDDRTTEPEVDGSGVKVG